jgi:hypothetical protein
MHLFQNFAARAAAVVVALGITPLLHAQVFNESGDAGSTVPQATGLSQPAQGGTATINGTLSSSADIDLFQISLSTPRNVLISTVNAITGSSAAPHGAGGLDTQLFLFDSLFRPVVMNDDAHFFNVLQSLIPQQNAFTAALAAGTYYIAIALSGVDPVNVNNQLLFAMNNGDTTSLRGPASGISPSTLNGWTGSANFNESGAYQINISTVPDNGGTLLLIGIGAASLLFAGRRVAVRAVSRS